jgi:hypothetical protein
MLTKINLLLLYVKSRHGGNFKGNDKKVFRRGAVLGSLSVFDNELNDDDSADIMTSITVSRGSILRLKFSDFHTLKYGLRDIVTLTEKEIEQNNIIECVETKVPHTLSTLLRKYHMIPNGTGDKTHKYLSHGSFGREVHMRDMKGTFIIIVLTGTIRIVIDRSVFRDSQGGKSSKGDEADGTTGGGSITCLRKGGEKSYFRVRYITQLTALYWYM